jgi:uncharacterized membrane protein
VAAVLRAFGFMRGNILVMTVCESLWRVSVDVIWPFLSLYVLALGGRYETIGVVMALGNLASMILYPLGGYIADYQGRIRIIGYMTFGYAAAFLIPALTNTWQWLAVGMFAQSLVTFYSPALLAMTADSIPPERRGIGFATSLAVPSAVGIASPMIGGWLIETYGIGGAMHGLFLLGFALIRNGRLPVAGVGRRGLAAVALGGILGMGVGGLLYIAAVQDAGAGKAAILSSTSPMFALPLAMFFLAERVTPRLMAGTLLSIVGIWLVV